MSFKNYILIFFVGLLLSTPAAFGCSADRSPGDEASEALHQQEISCSNCGSTMKALLACSGCHSAIYCSKKCQKAHWKDHKPTCKEIKEFITKKLSRYKERRGATSAQDVHLAAFEDDLYVLRALITSHDINAGDSSDNTPLHYAIMGKRPFAVKLLIMQHKIDVNRQNAAGTTPLCAAAMDNNEGIVGQLLAHPAVDVNKSSHAGLTPLHHAINQNSPSIIALLLKNPKTNPNPVTQYGETPLHFAARFGKTEAAAALLADAKIKARINSRTGKGKTALGEARENRHSEIIALLLNCGATE